MKTPSTWPTSSPENWTVCKTQLVLDPVWEPARANDEIVTAFRDGRVTLRKNRREAGFTNALKEIGYQHISKGDLVVHSMDGGFGAIGVSDADGKSSPVVHAYRSEVCDVQFVAYFLRAAISAGWVAANGKGIRQRSTQFDRPALAQLSIAFPDLASQKRIADYLDRETGEIDAMIAKMDQLVHTLETRRNAVMRTTMADKEQRYPRVPLQGLGQIGSGGAIPAEDIHDDGEYPVYGGNGRRGYTASFNQAHDRVLIGRQGALCGNVHLASAPFWASEHALVVSTYNDDIDLRWLAYAARDLDLGRLSTAAAQPGITASGVGRETVPLPPLNKQKRIADHLDEVTGRIDAMLTKVAELKSLLIERRAALITDVVTGRKEVA